MTKMLLDLEFGKTSDHRENVTSVIEKLADPKAMCTPHNDDEKWRTCSEMLRLSTMSFAAMSWTRVLWGVISTRWIDTDKGF